MVRGYLMWYMLVSTRTGKDDDMSGEVSGSDMGYQLPEFGQISCMQDYHLLGTCAGRRAYNETGDTVGTVSAGWSGQLHTEDEQWIE